MGKWELYGNAYQTVNVMSCPPKAVKEEFLWHWHLHVHEEPRESSPLPHLYPELLVTWAGHEVDGLLQERQHWNLSLYGCWCSSREVTAINWQKVEILWNYCRETMERELDVKCLFNSFLLKLLYFDYVYLYHTHTEKNPGFQQNYISLQFVL